MIQLTVALPAHNTKDILWLPLESLCRQKDIDFGWELLISEDFAHSFGAEKVAEYTDRLKAVGCESMQYFSVNRRLPLTQKWKHLSENISSTSKGFCLQAADDYAEPLRLRRSMDAMNEGFEWCQNRRGYFYHIIKKKLIEYDGNSLFKFPTGLNMCCSTAILNRLPKDVTLWMGVDRWFFGAIQPRNIKWIEGEMDGGIYTDGFNSISINRSDYYSKLRPPFRATTKIVSEIVPIEIVNQLNQLK